jgi:hypothetical protein
MSPSELTIKIEIKHSRIKKLLFWTFAYAHFCYRYALGKKPDDKIVWKLVRRFFTVEIGGKKCRLSA